MELHSLQTAEGSRTPRKRVGRGMGSGVGKTCGRGHKGQMARKGHKHKAAFEGGQMRLVRRLPKRGFKNPARKVYAAVNVGALSCFEDGAEVTTAMIKAAGLANGPFDGVKILGRGTLEKKLAVKTTAFSASARAKIEASGGTCEVTVI